MDVVSPATRSRMMAGIRGKNTKPELLVRSYLHRAGLRFRLHPKLPGKPDLVFPRYQTALFVHGCFWHRHQGCPFATTPTSNIKFWESKFRGNVQRDIRKSRELEDLGWRVLIIWSCDLEPKQLRKLAATIRKGSKPKGRKGD